MNRTFAGLHILWGSLKHEHFRVQGHFRKWRGPPPAAGCDTPHRNHPAWSRGCSHCGVTPLPVESSCLAVNHRPACGGEPRSVCGGCLLHGGSAVASPAMQPVWQRRQRVEQGAGSGNTALKLVHLDGESEPFLTPAIQLLID